MMVTLNTSPPGSAIWNHLVQKPRPKINTMPKHPITSKQQNPKQHKPKKRQNRVKRQAKILSKKIPNDNKSI